MSLKKEQVVQVTMMHPLIDVDSVNCAIMDGNSRLMIMMTESYGSSIAYKNISEGVGNKNGVADSGEIFSVWVQLPFGYDSISDNNLWHPTVPLNGENNDGVEFVRIVSYDFNRGRFLPSAQMRLTRTPTVDKPVTLVLKSELLSSLSAGTKGIDSYSYRYCRITLPLKPVTLERKLYPDGEVVAVRAVPNPFNPVVRFACTIPRKSLMGASFCIFSLSGQEIRSFELSHAPKGSGQTRIVTWDGTNETGQKVSGGVYLARVKIGMQTASERVVFLP